MYFLAADLIKFLEDQGCEFVGDEFTLGQGWTSPKGQTFALPHPDLINGLHWFDADVIEDNFRDRWLGYTIPLGIARYSLQQIERL